MALQFGPDGGAGGGALPSNQAIVTDGDTVTASGGQTIDISVADNVASFSVRSFPFWEPFTVTAAAVAEFEGSCGFVAGDAGSITNEPVDGFSLVKCYTYMADLVPTLFFQINGPTPLRDNLWGALLGVNAVDFTLDDYSVFTVIGAEGGFDTSFEVPGVTMWTVGQAVPIVIIPQS
jgi:hypothetical protein